MLKTSTAFPAGKAEVVFVIEAVVVSGTVGVVASAVDVVEGVDVESHSKSLQGHPAEQFSLISHFTSFELIP